MGRKGLNAHKIPNTVVIVFIFSEIEVGTGIDVHVKFGDDL